ncbi:MAG: hypothetical protein H0U19_09015, partial [Acidobacteria bacterium]|nr:hypothetical protein [Acidobacteriota bacterium]
LKGAKAATVRKRIQALDDRRIELAAEARSLGSAIKDIELDIGDIQKEIGEVAGTPDTAAEGGDTAGAADAPEPGPTAREGLSAEIERIGLLERAGDLSPEQARAAVIHAIQSAMGGSYGALSDRDRLELRGDLRDAQQAQTAALDDATSALKDLTKSIDEQNKFAASVTAVTSMQAVRALADIISGQLGVQTAGRNLVPGAGSLARY